MHTNKKQAIKSPITGDFVTRITDTINAKDIIDLYKKDGLDVSKRFEGVETILIVECKTSKYRFYYPYSIAGESFFYDELYKNRNPESEEFYRSWGYDYQFTFDRIKQDQKILDIGCGTGQFLKRIKEKTNNAIGLELNTKSHQFAKLQGLNVYNQTIQEFAKENQSQFDVVCIFQVLEHVSDVKSFLDAALNCLKKGGALIIAVPNNQPYQRQYDKYVTWNLPPHHVGLWNERSLRQIQYFFKIDLKEVEYDEKINRWAVDAYLRARYWLNIKTVPPHSIYEELKMLLLAPFSVPISLVRFFRKKINGSFIVVRYEKL